LGANLPFVWLLLPTVQWLWSPCLFAPRAWLLSP